MSAIRRRKPARPAIVLAAATHGGMAQYDYQAHLSRWSPNGELLASQNFGDADGVVGVGRFAQDGGVMASPR